MAQQTINVGTSPNDGTGTPLRTAFQYTNSNFTELYTAVGPSGNNIVVPGTATITGDLTVDTSTLKVDSANNRVGIGIASPIDVFQVSSNNPSVYITDNSIAGSDQANLYFGPNTVPTYAGILVDILNDTFNIRHNSSTRLSIGSTGIFTWQNVGGVAGTAMTLNSTGLGVGASPSYKLDVNGAIAATVASGAAFRAIRSSSGDRCLMYPLAAGSGINIQSQNAAESDFTPLIFGGSTITFNYRSGVGTLATGMTLDSLGNVGVGVTPSTLGSVYRSIEFSRGVSMFAQTDAASLELSCNAYINSSFLWTYKTTDLATHYRQYNGTHQWHTAPSGTAGNAITFTQAMTLTASGELLVGTTSSLPSFANGRIEALAAASSYGMVIDATDTSASGIGIRGNTSTVAESYFNASAGTTVGSIVINAGGVSFNNTSDYRIKKDVQPLTGGLARVNALKPSVYKFKHDDSTGEGFLAHELAEVVPFAVTGEKDAVNEDGSIKPQGVDLSKVVPILVAAIKELTAEVNALKNA